MKLIKLIEAMNVIGNLDNNNDISSKLAYMLAKFTTQSRDEYKFYFDELEKILEKYGASFEDGNYKIPKENREAFEYAVSELQGTEVSEPAIKFPLSEITKDLKLSIKQMVALLDFINDDIGEVSK